MIFSASFNHGVTYYFKYHKNKLIKLDFTKSLSDFLTKIHLICPNHYFFKGPRSSILKFNIDANLEEKDHEIKLLARMGLDTNYYKDAHMNVQTFMLAYDKSTVAMEVPIWLEEAEMDKFKEIFKTTKPLSGHIDIIRIEDQKIWIWDFKPNAHREKYAHTQTYFYALMLSKRTKIPLEKFMCGYFDDKKVYTFNPSNVNITTQLNPQN
ncbi:MAG: PD-(D/E)XK nuclease family protein [Candidatus Woesearchaeota archaeon]